MRSPSPSLSNILREAWHAFTLERPQPAQLGDLALDIDTGGSLHTCGKTDLVVRVLRLLVVEAGGLLVITSLRVQGRSLLLLNQTTANRSVFRPGQRASYPQQPLKSLLHNTSSPNAGLQPVMQSCLSQL